MRKVLRFLAGLAVGLVALSLLSVVGFAIHDVFLWPFGGGAEHAVMNGIGIAASRRGAADLVISSPDLLIRQTCRGACDDAPWLSGTGLGARILDSRGRPLAERPSGPRRPPWDRQAWWIGLSPSRVDAVKQP